VTDPMVARFWRKEFAVTNARKRQCKSEADLNPASTSEDGTISEVSIWLVRMRTELSCDPIVTLRISLKNKKFFRTASY
jgi:hypothetical protein